jgi:hypothetical protein
MRYKFWAPVAFFLITLFSFLGFDWGIVSSHRLRALGIDETPHLLEDIAQLTREKGYSVNLHVAGHEEGLLELQYINYVLHLTWDKDREAYLRIYRHYLSWSYSGDVATAFGPLSTMKPYRFDFNPHSFQYGGAFLYPLALTLKISSWMGYSHVVSDATYYIVQPLELRKLILAGRTLVVLMHLLTLILIYKTAKLWKGEWVGILAVVLYLFLPGPISLARELKPHAYAVGWVMLSFYFSLRYLRQNRDLYWVISSIGAGLAAGSLLNYGLAVLYPVLSICGGKREKRVHHLIFSLLLASFTFLITNPYALLSYPILFQEMSVLNRVLANSSKTAVLTPWANMFNTGMPWYLSLTAGLSLVFYLFSNDRFSEKLLIIVLPTTYTVSYYLASHGMCPSRFAIILYPSLTMLAAAGIYGMIQKIRWAGIVFATILIGTISLKGTAYVVNFTLDSMGESTVFQAGRFIDTLPAGTRLGFIQFPVPGVVPAIPFQRYNLITFPDFQHLEQTPERNLPDYLLISNIYQLYPIDIPRYQLQKTFSPFSFGTRQFFKPDSLVSVGSPALDVRIYRKTKMDQPPDPRNL